ncbi:alkaline phosphatase family protein [Megalodesulfovibrio paquesii]
MHDSPRNAGKILVIGWDGATFDMIRPLVAAGRMPTVARLLAEGMHAPLNSTTPAVTPVAWSSFMTGVNPGSHGIFDAFRYDAQAKTLRLVHAGLRTAPTLFKILDERGRPSGSLNIPMTWPPDRLAHGFVFTGMFTAGGAADKVHPPELAADVARAIGNQTLEPAQHPEPATYLKNIIQNIRTQETLTLHLMQARPWDLLASVFIDSDRVQHYFWKYTDPAHPQHAALGEAIAQVYEALDAALGRLLAAAPAGTRLCMVSDHGAGPLHTTVFLNKWLMDHGYLVLKQDLSTALAATRAAGHGAGRPSRLKHYLKQILPASVTARLRRAMAKGEQARRDRFLELVDWERTTALSEGVSGGIYLNSAIMTPARREEVERTLIAELPGILDPKNGTHPITAVRRRAELFSGAAAEHAPDLLVACAPGYQIIVPNELLRFDQKFDGDMFLAHQWSGRHEQFGILVLHGPGVRHAVLPWAEMPDVAPTLLHLLGEAVPPHMEGRVLREVLEGEADTMAGASTVDATTHVAETRELTPEEEAAIAQQLQDLGYL